MALDTIPKQEGGKLKAVASGTLPSGQPVVVNADGTVSVIEETSVSESVGTATTFKTASSSSMATAYDPVNNKVLVVWSDGSASSVGKGVVGTVSGTSISFGSEVVWQSGNRPEYVDAAYDVSTGKFVVVYSDGNNTDYGTSVVATISGTSVSFGTPVVFQSSQSYWQSIVYDPSSEKVVVAYRDPNFAGGSARGSAVVGTVSGTSISFGSRVTFIANDIWYNNLVYDPVNQQVVNLYLSFVSAPYAIKAVVGTVSGTSISFGSESSLSSDDTRYLTASYDENANKIVAAYTFASVNEGAARVLTISGATVTSGTEATWSATQVTWIGSVYHPLSKKVYITFTDNGNSDYRAMIPATVSGTDVTFGSKITLLTAQSLYGSSAYDSTGKVLVHVYRGTASDYGYASVIQTPYSETNLTSENYIGMSQGVVTGSVSAVGTPAVSSAVQSSYFGSTFDSNSNKVVVTYRDETNSKGMAVVGTVSGTSISFGTPVQYSSQSALTYSQAVVFDSNSNKVVIAYVDSGGSSYGTAIVGTVSGTSISFGTAVVFESASTAYPQATFDNVNNKVIIAYEDGGDSDKGKAVVGTVSGTSISFGSTATFNAGLTAYPAIAYDTNAQKVVVAYRDRSGSDHGKAVVGTVSGTSISFGSATTFNAANTNYNIVVYDEAAQKVVVYYQGADTNMEAIVGTVSGTSISFGTAAEFSASNSTNMSATYDANAAKTVVFYRDASNSSYGTYNAGTIDGTSISFSDPVVFEAADSRFTTGTYDSNSQKVVVSYEDVGNSQYATSTVINVGYINRAEVADGDAATVDIVGTVSKNQVSLTAGQQYYVQTDGTIGETADDPSVLAGTAVSATKMVVKS